MLSAVVNRPLWDVGGVAKWAGLLATTLGLSAGLLLLLLELLLLLLGLVCAGDDWLTVTE